MSFPFKWSKIAFDARVEFLRSQSAIRVEFKKNKKIFTPGSMWTHTLHSGVYTEEYVFKIDEPFSSFIFVKRKSDEK